MVAAAVAVVDSVDVAALASGAASLVVLLSLLALPAAAALPPLITFFTTGLVGDDFGFGTAAVPFTCTVNLDTRAVGDVFAEADEAADAAGAARGNM